MIKIDLFRLTVNRWLGDMLFVTVEIIWKIKKILNDDSARIYKKLQASFEPYARDENTHQ